MQFEKFKFTLRAGLGLAVFLIMLIVALLVSLNNINQAENKLNRLGGDLQAKTAVIEFQREMIQEIQIRTRNIALLTDADMMQQELKMLQVARNLYDQAEARFDQIFANETDKALFLQAKQLRAIARPLADRVIQLGLENKDKEATELLMKEVVPATDARLQVLQKIEAQQKALVKRTTEEASSAHFHVRVLMFLLGGFALLLGLLVAGVVVFFAYGLDAAKAIEQ